MEQKKKENKEKENNLNAEIQRIHSAVAQIKEKHEKNFSKWNLNSTRQEENKTNKKITKELNIQPNSGDSVIANLLDAFKEKAQTETELFFDVRQEFSRDIVFIEHDSNNAENINTNFLNTIPEHQELDGFLESIKNFYQEQFQNLEFPPSIGIILEDLNDSNICKTKLKNSQIVYYDKKKVIQNLIKKIDEKILQNKKEIDKNKEYKELVEIYHELKNKYIDYEFFLEILIYLTKNDYAPHKINKYGSIFFTYTK
ncbi:MAG: hypothetical protein N4A49_16845 [Marinifilaceae bacterium]|jgi:hypothetical protein|nr:hypothetical protein [Marinifilaceae bacterium]